MVFFFNLLDSVLFFSLQIQPIAVRHHRPMLPKIAMLWMSYHFDDSFVHLVYRDVQTMRALFEVYQQTMDVHPSISVPFERRLYLHLFRFSSLFWMVVVLREPSKHVAHFLGHVLVVLYLFFVLPYYHPHKNMILL